MEADPVGRRRFRLAMLAVIVVQFAVFQIVPAVAAQDVSAAQARAIIEGDASIIILDVRTPAEFRTGHIKGAINIDYYRRDFAARIGRLDPERTYLLYCRVGNRSGHALEIMKSAGLTHVYHLSSGFVGWRAAGYESAGKKQRVADRSNPGQ